MNKQAQSTQKTMPPSTLMAAQSGLAESQNRKRFDTESMSDGKGRRPQHDYGCLKSQSSGSSQAQPRLKISAPDDEYEREADRLAAQATQKSITPIGETYDDKLVPTTAGIKPIYRSQAHQTALAVDRRTESRIQTVQRGAGEPLPERVRNTLGTKLGHDLGNVRVHRNPVANDVAADMQARALSVGNHIIFARGQYPLGREESSKLLMHEVVHTQQQQQGAYGLIQRAPMVKELGAPEKGPESAPEEDMVKGGSDLDVKLNSISRRIRRLLHNIFGEPGAPADEVWAGLFAKDLFSNARQAAEKYRAITNELATRSLDVAFAAQWLEVAISTLNALSAPLAEVAGSRNTQAAMAKTLARKTRKILKVAQRLRTNARITRGSALAKEARSGVRERLRREQDQAEQQRRVESRPGLIELSQASEVDLLRFKFAAEQDDPEFVDVLNQEIKISEAINEGRLFAPEKPLIWHEDKLSTIEHSGREDASHLLARMEKDALMKLAESGSRERLGKLGLELAESTPLQTTTGLVSTPIPILGPKLADIVSERWEEKKAIKHMAEAFAASGGPSTLISVPDIEKLTNLKITRTGDRITFQKSELLHQLSLLDAARSGSEEVPRRAWTFSPEDLVTLRLVDSGQSLSLPAFAWLHMEDNGLEATYQEWATIVQTGVSITRASIKATSAETAGLGSVPAPASTTKLAAGKTPPAGPGSTGGPGIGGVPDVPGPGLVKVKVSDDIFFVDANVAANLAKRDLGLGLKAGEARMAAAAERMSKSRLPALTPTGAKQFGKKADKIPVNRAFPLVSRPKVKPSEVKSLMEKLRDARVGGKGGNIHKGGVSDRRIVAEAMITGSRSGKTPIFMTGDKKVINGLARVRYRADSSFINPDKLGGYPTVSAALEAWGLKTFQVSIGQFKLIVRPVQ